MSVPDPRGRGHSAGRIVQRDGQWFDVPPLADALQAWVYQGGDDALELFQLALDMAVSVDEVDLASGTDRPVLP